MYKRPGDNGLIARLEQLEHRISELSRRGGPVSERVARVKLDAAAGVIDIAELPQYGYENLQLIISAGITDANIQGIRCQFNGLTSGYDTQVMQAIGTGVSAARLGDIGAIEVGVCGLSTWNTSSTSEAIIANYADADRHFTTARASYVPTNAAMRDWSAAGFYWGQPFVAINRLTLFPAVGQFTAGTTVTVYGLP